ncbi:MAG: SDR family oxidoreductase [Bacteroidales bacterium]|nr:SDR family oxidoreductase [Bacteroidales bacterium]
MKILITGGAGFIGSNLCDAFIEQGYKVVCLDNFSTGKRQNIEHLLNNPAFTLIEGDIRHLPTCQQAVEGCTYVLQQAALGSVPRSIKDPATTNEVNISGFLNMLIAARDAGVKRFVYAASSSTYGDSKILPKVEEQIGKPLSPYAITKYVNELYADVFAKTYNMQCVGLRYFNVFGKRQAPDGAYAAVIPLWVKQMIQLQAPTINGNGEYSRDFTYIDNIVQANQKAMLAPDENLKNNEGYINQVFNAAYGGNTTLNQLFATLKNNLSQFKPEIANLKPVYGPNRPGDIPHSQASIEKAKKMIGYKPKYSAPEGFEKACEWYFNNLD